MSVKVIPIPEKLAHLPTDKRGYPIPYNVWRDTDGEPHFTINDTAKVVKIIEERRCPICGNELDQTFWFCGGPMSALHDNGAYIDQPMHETCVKYALQVCPYMAAPIYSKRIDAKTVSPDKWGDTIGFQDDTVIPERPSFFVIVQTDGYTAKQVGAQLWYLKPYRPYLKIEYWLHGERITKAQAVNLIELTTEKD